MTLAKTFSLLFLFLFLASCGKGGGGSDSSSAMNQDFAVSDSGNVPNEALTFQTNVHTFGFSADEDVKIQHAEEAIKKVVASEEFKHQVLNFTHNGKKQFFDTTMSNVQVYRTILLAAEIVAGGGANNTMDLEMQLYSDGTNVIGYTLPNVVRIWSNAKYFKTFGVPDIAGNMFHEWLHKLGFVHSMQATPDRPSSVPYAIGYIVRSLAAKYL